MNPRESPDDERDASGMTAARPTLNQRSQGVARADEALDLALDVSTSKRSVIYLRVSTPSQVNTDYNPEGISIPAQREACERKARSLGAKVCREFIEPGRTATSIDKRPVFQEMLAWVKAEDPIDFIVVYHFNRIFRNSIDAAITKQALSKLGVRLVSSILDMGEGPESAMVESIIHAVDQYQSQASGADISYKMLQKARNGGTLGRSPLGYLNKRDQSEGRDIGIVVIDPERGPLIRVAFELYASGDYTLEQLVAELTLRGLRSRPGRHPAGPIVTSTLHKILQDPYYMGRVTYKGDEFPGRHEPLVTEELFDQVQSVMASRSGSGVRQRKHHHYLKGFLWCGDCHAEGRESRLIQTWVKGNGGDYEYFFCRSKQNHVCKSRYLGGDVVEDTIVDHYATIVFPADAAEQLRDLMSETLADEEQSTKLLHRQLTAELLRLDTKEENLLDLVADGELSSSKIKKRLSEISHQRSRVQAQLEQSDERLLSGARLIESALALLASAQDVYRSMGPDQRRLMNQAVFEKLYLWEEGVSEAEFKPPFDELLLVRDQVSEHLLGSHKSRRQATNSDCARHPLTTALLGIGSNKGLMVGLPGFEPGTSASRTQRANQAAPQPVEGIGCSHRP
jgi:site-specific DNA recombinase